MPSPIDPGQPGGPQFPTGPLPAINNFTPESLESLGRQAAVEAELLVTFTLTTPPPPPPDPTLPPLPPPTPPTFPMDLIRLWPEPDGIKVFRATFSVPLAWDPVEVTGMKSLKGTERNALVSMLSKELGSLQTPFYLWAGNALYEVRQVSSERGTLSGGDTPDRIGIAGSVFRKG